GIAARLGKALNNACTDGVGHIDEDDGNSLGRLQQRRNTRVRSKYICLAGTQQFSCVSRDSGSPPRANSGLSQNTVLRWDIQHRAPKWLPTTIFLLVELTKFPKFSFCRKPTWPSAVAV